MKGDLIKSAYEVYKSEGLKSTIGQTLRYLNLYGTPDKVLKMGLCKLAGVDEVVGLVNERRMILNLKMGGIHKDLYLNGIREPICTHYMKTFLRSDDLVLDIGANIGYYVLLEASIVDNKVDIVAVEPDPSNFELLELNLRLNKLTNVCTIKSAVGESTSSKVIKFHIAEASNWNRIATSEDDPKTIIEVPIMELGVLTRSIKESHGRLPTFLRMDVEGYEQIILESGSSFLQDCEVGTRLFIEVHRDLLRRYNGSQMELLGLLSNYGFDINRSIILGKEGLRGPIDPLLKYKYTREALDKGIASWMFFEKVKK